MSKMIPHILEFEACDSGSHFRISQGFAPQQQQSATQLVGPLDIIHVDPHDWFNMFNHFTLIFES